MLSTLLFRVTQQLVFLLNNIALSVNVASKTGVTVNRCQQILKHPVFLLPLILFIVTEIRLSYNQ